MASIGSLGNQRPKKKGTFLYKISTPIRTQEAKHTKRKVIEGKPQSNCMSHVQRERERERYLNTYLQMSREVLERCDCNRKVSENVGSSKEWIEGWVEEQSQKTRGAKKKQDFNILSM